MNTLLIATHNQAKLEELKLGITIIAKKGVKILSLSDLKIKSSPEETGQDFRENAKIKARFYGNLTNLLTLADDGGLTIPYLNNEPGVKSRRWLGYEASDEELINYALSKLKNVPAKNRVAFLQTCICFYKPGTKETYCKLEKIKGSIAYKKSGRPTAGYPYRALFIVNKYSKYYDELSEDEHKQINHRLKALKKITRIIKKYL